MSIFDSLLRDINLRLSSIETSLSEIQSNSALSDLTVRIVEIEANVESINSQLSVAIASLETIITITIPDISQDITNATNLANDNALYAQSLNARITSLEAYHTTTTTTSTSTTTSTTSTSTSTTTTSTTSTSTSSTTTSTTSTTSSTTTTSTTI